MNKIWLGFGSKRDIFIINYSFCSWCCNTDVKALKGSGEAQDCSQTLLTGLEPTQGTGQAGWCPDLVVRGKDSGPISFSKIPEESER